MAQEKEEKSFKETLNLPHTDFPIRSNPKVEDPEMVKRWEREDLFYTSFIHNMGHERYILLDGPPYANGPIHLGHAYNKILKDFIGKSNRMGGNQVPITPGWDCHGLPIELKVTKEFPGLPSHELRIKCREYANKWVNVQRQEFKELGVLMNWAHPYLTMDYWFEAKILEALGIFVAQDFLTKKKKTVPWCPEDQTVLATAEIEYKERRDPSVYVRFPLGQEAIDQLCPELKGKPVSLLVWTTTPWTLPLNRALLVKPNAVYQVLEHDGQYIILGKDLADKVCELTGIEKKVIKELLAEQLVQFSAHHPFITGLSVPIILDHFVALNEGTAVVHCAPGCGPQDYDVAIKNNLEIFSPISPDGKYTEGIEPEELVGMPVSEGQIWVIKKLHETGNLFFKHSIRHSYPHCWRCRNGLIFRATNQWFLDLEKHNLKKRALKAIERITFLPKRSINFLRATIEGRLEWCISRQRIWGVPIPALLCISCDYAYISKKLIDKVAEGVKEEGVEYWERVDIKTLGFDDLKCLCGETEFLKEQDILDVWFDSGVIHYAVLYKNPELAYPAEIFVEGVDQHRGWFQSSLLTSMVLEPEACTKAFLTHGFTVDEKGHKMSKSLGNVISPDQIAGQIGMDGLRLWASSIDYGGDAIVSEPLLKNIQQVYRKIRNTCRFLLSNLYDFDFSKDKISLEHMLLIDRFALERLFEINLIIRHAYATKDFTAIFHTLADYCTVDLSQFYLDITKDRLYVEKPDGRLRRSAQTAIWNILDTITKLMAPILSFTAEQVSDYYQKDKKESIHLQPFPNLDFVWREVEQDITHILVGARTHHVGMAKTLQAIEKITHIANHKKQFDLLQRIRSALLKAIELEREKGLIKHPLEVQLNVYVDFADEDKQTFKALLEELTKSDEQPERFFKDMMVVSQYNVADNEQGFNKTELEGLWVEVKQAEGEKCPRCWQFDITEHEDKLCRRCQGVLS